MKRIGVDVGGTNTDAAPGQRDDRRLFVQDTDHPRRDRGDHGGSGSDSWRARTTPPSMR